MVVSTLNFDLEIRLPQQLHNMIKTGQRWLRLTKYLNLESEVNRLKHSAPPRSYEDLKFTTAVSAKSIGRIVVPTCEAIVHALKD